jgi:hypothetical protein
MPELEYSVSLETDLPQMPDFCCCCGGEATESIAPEPPGRMRGLPQPEEALAFPYCAECKAHIRKAQDRKTSNLFALNLAIWGIAIPLAARMPGLSLAVGPALGGAFFLKNRGTALRANPQCTAVGAAARVTWLRKHTYIYSFSRKETADAFLELNQGAR